MRRTKDKHKISLLWSLIQQNQMQRYENKAVQELRASSHLWFVCFGLNQLSWRTQCIFPLVQFKFTQTKCQVTQNVSTNAMWKLSVCSLVRNVGHIPSPSVICQTFWTLHDLYVFSSCWALCSSAQKSRWHRLCSRSTVDSYLCHGKLLALCLQSHPQPIMHSRAVYRGWFNLKCAIRSFVTV